MLVMWPRNLLEYNSNYYPILAFKSVFRDAKIDNQSCYYVSLINCEFDCKQEAFGSYHEVNQRFICQTLYNVLI